LFSLLIDEIHFNQTSYSVTEGRYVTLNLTFTRELKDNIRVYLGYDSDGFGDQAAMSSESYDK